jgi:outer membrane lipoprotein-sorting protein
MTPIILTLALLNPVPLDTHGEELLNKMAQRYSAAEGIQWTMQSEVHSPAFDETETTPVEFTFNTPDTFYFKSPQEEILGIADTIWVMSKRHKQIQKKHTEAYVMPADLIINWQDRYIVEGYSVKKNTNEFELVGHEDVKPSPLKLTVGKDDGIRIIYYKDSSGNDVTLKIKNEKLARASKLNLFHQKTPKGYKFIDLTE